MLRVTLAISIALVAWTTTAQASDFGECISTCDGRFPKRPQPVLTDLVIRYEPPDAIDQRRDKCEASCRLEIYFEIGLIKPD